MAKFLLIIALAAALYYAIKYYRQRRTIRFLAASLAERHTVLAHSKDFKAASAHLGALTKELNAVVEENARLTRESSGQLDQLETTLGSMQEGVLIVDRDNYILLINKALRAMLPSLNDKLGQRLESGLSGSQFLEFVWQFKKGKGSGRQEISFAATSAELWFEVTAAKLTQALSGDGPWYLFVLHDITKLKQLEMARRHFVANASHELKTPVSVIKGYAETLVSDHESMSSEDRDRFLRTIQRHSDRLALLINDLLSLSRLENGSPAFHWTESNVLEWIREIAADYRSNRGQRGVTVQLSIPKGIPGRARFDVLKLRQVFDNLVENAVKYSPDGGLVTLGAEATDQELILWVDDEGPGVPDQDLIRIFERFYRVDKGRSRETGGTGLGLSIVKHIVEWHGGRVWAERREGGGLRVAFRLPLLADQETGPSGRKTRDFSEKAG